MAFTDKGRRGDGAGERVSFWEIFKHAWPILFERPKALIALVVALTVATQLVSFVEDWLKIPYQPFLDAFWEAQSKAPSAESNRVLWAAIKSLGYGRLGLSLLLPYLLAPWTWLALCQASLAIWDGWRLGPQTLLFAARHYLSGLKIMALISFFAVFLFLFSLLALLPFLLVQGLIGQGGPSGAFILSLMGLAAGLFFFVKILWPHLRRFLLLQFLVYFRLADGERGPWAGRIWRLYEVLRAYPSHMNQGVGVFMMSFLGVSLVMGVILTMLNLAKLPGPAVELVSGTLFFFGLMWPLTALAGFHRLLLSPLERSSPLSDEPFNLPQAP
jgi:hypothetical protein